MEPARIARTRTLITVTGGLKANGVKNPGIEDAVPGASTDILNNTAMIPARPPPIKLAL